MSLNRVGVTSLWKKISNSGSQEGKPAFVSPLVDPLGSFQDLISRCITLNVGPGVESLEE